MRVRPRILGIALSLLPTLTFAATPAARIPTSETDKSVLTRRLRVAYKATGLQGKRLVAIEGAKTSYSGANFNNEKYLAPARMKLLPLTEQVSTTTGLLRKQRMVRTRLSGETMYRILDGERATLLPKLAAHQVRTAELEHDLLERQDQDFVATRAGWHDKIKTASSEKLGLRAMALIQELDHLASDRDARQIETGSGSSSSDSSSESTQRGVFGRVKGHASSESSTTMSFKMNTLVLGASTYRLDLVEQKHLATLDGFSKTQRTTPEARLLAERFLQTVEIVQELQRRDASDPTGRTTGSAPFKRWVEESTLEVALPHEKQTFLDGLGPTTIVRGDTPTGAPLRMSSLKQELVNTESKFDFMTPAFRATLKSELKDQQKTFSDELPSLD